MFPLDVPEKGFCSGEGAAKAVGCIIPRVSPPLFLFFFVVAVAFIHPAVSAGILYMIGSMSLSKNTLEERVESAHRLLEGGAFSRVVCRLPPKTPTVDKEEEKSVAVVLASSASSLTEYDEEAVQSATLLRSFATPAMWRWAGDTPVVLLLDGVDEEEGLRCSDACTTFFSRWRRFRPAAWRDASPLL